MSTALAALGLTDTATAEEVKQAFRDKARLLHPDLGGDAAEFDAFKQNYNEALHEVLHRPCPTCGGKRRVNITVGWRTVQLPCPQCG